MTTPEEAARRATARASSGRSARCTVLRPGGRLVIDDRSVPEDDEADARMNEIERPHGASHVRERWPSACVCCRRRPASPSSGEPHVHHRPLSAMTEQVAPENVAKMIAALASRDARLRALFGLATANGGLHVDRWDALVGATKR
jgi:hypothetical protein